MAELIAQFEEAVRNVEPSDDDKRDASDAHQEVRDCLSEDPGLNAWGIETVLIGSYKRHVSIRRVRDVDVLSKLPDFPDGVAPGDVLDAVGTALRSCYPIPSMSER
jgi:tRNA nucleotidyltransferase (CCA-adding enzyme)